MQCAAAHDAAVTQALEYVQREACWVRLGTGGHRLDDGSGLLAAAFRHRTSRAGDPHLHTHVLVANFTRRPDGRWAALDGRQLFVHAKTAGYLYEAALRHELTARLGLDWRPVRNGIAELAGMPEQLCSAFSKRRREIEDELARLSLSGARAAQTATLKTRRPKDRSEDYSLLHSRWRAETRALGLDPDRLHRLLHSSNRTAQTRVQTEVQTSTELVGPAGLTAQRTSFDRRDVLQAWAARRPHGAPVAEIEQLANRTLTSGEVVPLNAGITPMRGRGGRRFHTPTGTTYTTRELLALERRTVEHALGRSHEGCARVDPTIAMSVLHAQPVLADEQSDLVLDLVTSGRGVDVVIAPAGAGKTTTLGCAAEVWRAAGYQVIGAALAARAARELDEAAHIPSTTIARRLLAIENDRLRFGPDTILVVDEAGMVGTRTLSALLEHAERARAKVVLVGDPRQLPEIDAGGLLAGLAERLPVLELKTNRRQREQWERDALHALRTGYTARALDAYTAHDALYVAHDHQDAYGAIVEDWADAYGSGERVLMLATRRADVDRLNALARRHLRHTGQLAGAVLEESGRQFQAGDRVMLRRNDARLNVCNGQTGAVVSVERAARSLIVAFDDGACRAVPHNYIAAGGVDHGYATTIHKAQGLTVDRCLVLADELIYRESAYVALSRGRARNQLYVVNDGIDVEHAAHGPTWQRDSVASLKAALATSRSQSLALDQLDRGTSVERDVGLSAEIEL